MGGQRGTRVELQLTGTNLAGPTELWTGFGGKHAIPTDDKNGTDNAKLKVLLDVPPDAPVGYYQLRLATTRGMSNLRVFCVDDLPQVIDNDKNAARTTAQDLPVPSVVAGRINAEQSDWYKITAKSGQRLSFDALGRRIGSALEPQITIYHAKTGREIAHDTHSPGTQSDARLSHVFKEGGDYLVEIRDLSYRGGAEYFYRLRIGDFPLASTPLPMAAKAGTTVKVSFAGPYVDGAAPVDVSVPSDAGRTAIWVAPKGAGGLHGMPVVLTISELDGQMEVEPNNEPAKAQRLKLPAGVTGRLQPSDDLDSYIFGAKKGDKLAINVQTLEQQSPTLVYMVLKNAKGAELAKSNPAAAPPADQRIEYTVTEDGDLSLEVQHLHFLGGPSETYYLTITPNVPSFDVAMTLERFDLSAGAFAPLPMTINRKGYAGPIELEIVGSSTLMGKATVKAGQNAIVFLAVAKVDAPLGAQTLAIRARAVIDKQPVSQLVNVKIPVGQSLGLLPYSPLPWNNLLALAVKEKAPFELGISMDPPEGTPGLPTTVKVTVKREAGFDDPIELTAPLGFPTNATPPKLAPFSKDQKELTFKLDLNPKVPIGEYQVLFGAKSKFKGKDVSASAPPLTVLVAAPFELKMAVDAVTLKPGDKTKLKVTATRRGGYAGPIALEFRKLPANVTASKVVINADQTSVEIELNALPAAVAAEIADADILGTATGLANLQNASPALKLKIEKK